MQALREELQDILTPCEQAARCGHRDALRDPHRRGERGRQDHHHRQAGAPLPDEGRSVMLAAGDTFRAAAVEQLQHWGERHDVPVIAQHTGADSASR
jgi:fused signal recognition particle receptor